MGARLVTTRYTPPGTYIGQLIRPTAGNLTADARICNYIGQGSRLAVGSNLGIRRSFVFGESLSFPTSAPFETTLQHSADGEKGLPTKVFDSITGVELREDQWTFTKIGNNFKKVLISQAVYNPNAAYKIDYQSKERGVKDPIPVDNIRQIKLVGVTQDRAQFTDYVNFYTPYSFSGPTVDDANYIADPLLTSIFADGGNVGGGTVTQDAASSYGHNYNRFYALEVTAISGVSGSYTATFDWSSRRYSGGAGSLPPTPLDTSATKPSFTALEASPAVQELELGIKLEITFDPTNFSVGDKFYFNGVGPGLIEFDQRYLSDQYLSFGTIQYLDGPGTGTGTLGYSVNNTYNGDFNCKFRLEVTAVSGSSPTRTVDFVWAQYGEVMGATSSVSVAEATSLDFSLTEGVELTLDFGATNFAVGDVFDFEVKSPRIYYQAKDDRTYTLTVSAATTPGADTGHVEGAYSTGTTEGGFGTWSADTNLLFGPSQETGFFQLPNGVNMFVRNAMRGNINGTSYAAGDSFVGSVTSDDVIDWALTTKVEETRETTALLTDVTGSVTGTAGTKYVILDNVYEVGSVSVVDTLTSTPISHIEIPGTRFLAFVTEPTDTFTISYEFRGEEPEPGQLYFLTANYLRPKALYNVPTQILDRDEGRLFLGPSEVTNHLFTMNELVFDNAALGAVFTQVYDKDGDGVLTDTDFEEALNAHEKDRRPTDLCVLSHFSVLGKSLAVNETANDPFEKRAQMLWVGTPIDTAIGDVDTPNSLVFLSRRTLQVQPTSFAQGTRVLLAPTKCKKKVILDSGLEQELTLDGSFVAGATSAKVNSFADPATTVLRQNLAGFSSIQTYNETQNLILGQNSILWMSDQGSSVFRFEEDITVHTMSEEFQLISATTQKQFVNRVVTRELDANLISVVVPNAAAGIAIIRSTLAGIILGLLGNSRIANYQDEDTGEVREFDPTADILVLRDSSTLTKYDLFYAFFIKSPIKRIFGLFSVNTNDFGA